MNVNGLSGRAGRRNGESIETGDEDAVHGESGGVVAASETSVRGEGGSWDSSSSSSHGRLM